MRHKKATLKDVSKLSGFSIKTISRVINNGEYVKKETKEKVLSTIEELNYKPDYFARNLKSKRSNIIGYIVPDLASQFFGLVFNGIEKEFRKAGYNILVSISDGKKELEINSIDILISNRVEGIIFASTGLSGEYVKKQVELVGIPFVLIDNKLKGIQMNCVLHDNIMGAEILTEHLIKIHNQNKIAIVTGPIHETSSKRRLEGYKNALLKNNININKDFIKIGEFNNNSGYIYTKELLALKERPDSIFVTSCAMALGVLKAIREIGLNIPRDIKLVSFDNLDFTEATNPPLTTLSKVDEKIGEEAAKLLKEKINNETQKDFLEIYIPMEIVIRNSCGCNSN